MRIIDLQRRTPLGLGLRITIETIDKETHSVLAERHATTVPEMNRIARGALDQCARVVDEIAQDGPDIDRTVQQALHLYVTA